MPVVPHRLAELRAVLDAKRTIHHELAAPLTLPSLRRIAAREGVELLARPHARMGELLPLLGRWTIIIDSSQPKLAWKIIGAHELAHLWLHVDPFFSRSEIAVYDASPPWYDQVREEEADVFAELLVRGPGKDAPNPYESSSPYDAVGKRRKKSQRRPPHAKQLELADPDGDAFLAMVKRAPKDPLPAPDPSPLMQFAIPTHIWRSVRLHAVRRRAWHSTYRDNLSDSIASDGHEVITCTESVAAAIVADLAEQGLTRDAARIRLTIRQTRHARERG